ncbi:UNVERIFIED_ORG: hypothetical protein GGI66_003677 [Rhizobium esperanzae]
MDETHYSLNPSGRILQHRLDRVRRHKWLLAHIRSSRADFAREVESRRRLLATLEPQTPIDPLVAEIEKQWTRLFEDYRRYRRAIPYPGERGGWR